MRRTHSASPAGPTISVWIAVVVATAVAALAGCATLAAPGSGPASTLLIGQIKLDAHGVGQANNGANGLLNSYYPAGTVMTIANASDGATYQPVTLTPANLFALPNLPPGRYKIVELWCQVQSMNAWITLDTKFDTSPVFDVNEGQVANLGVLLWRVDFDLWGPTARADLSTVAGSTDTTARAFARRYAGSPWLAHRSDSVALSGESETTTSAVALQPRESGSIFLWPIM